MKILGKVGALCATCALVFAPSVAFAEDVTEGFDVQPPAAVGDAEGDTPVVDPTPDVPTPDVPDDPVVDPTPDVPTPDVPDDPAVVPTPGTGSTSTAPAGNSAAPASGNGGYVAAPGAGYSAVPVAYGGPQLAATGVTSATPIIGAIAAVLTALGGVVLNQRRAMFHGAHAGN